MIPNHTYYQFGSKDSTDIDVLIEVEQIPQTEQAIQYMKSLNSELNMNMIIVRDGIVIDTLASKGTIDGINNSLFNTYDNHVQVYPNPIKRLVPRHKLLNLYRCIHTCLTNCTRIDSLHRSNVMPLKGIHPFANKVESLKWLDYTKIDTFNQRYQTDTDTWKTLAFYIGQTLSLLIDDIEIYDKSQLIENHPTLFNMIYRKQLTYSDKVALQHKKNELVSIIDGISFDNPKQSNGFYNILTSIHGSIDMYERIALC